MTTINVVTTTVDQTFPVGTVDTPFTVSLVGADGVAVESATVGDDGTASFPNVAAGTYTVTGVKNGVTVTSSPVVVPEPTLTLKVPASITVTLA